MARARFHSGHVFAKAPYTPSGSAVAAGDVVVVNNIPMIAVVNMPVGQLGSLNAGGGVYTVTGDAAITAGKWVYWNASTNKVTETASTHKLLGFTVTACAADNGKCEVAHLPELPT